MHHPVGEPRQRGRRDGAPEPVGPAQAARGRQERGAEAHERQQGADQARLRERAQLDAVRVVGGLFAAPVREVLLLEVVRADPDQRMVEEFVERDAVEVVAIAAQPARQPVAAVLLAA